MWALDGWLSWSECCLQAKRLQVPPPARMHMGGNHLNLSIFLSLPPSLLLSLQKSVEAYSQVKIKKNTIKFFKGWAKVQTYQFFKLEGNLEIGYFDSLFYGREPWVLKQYAKYVVTGRAEIRTNNSFHYTLLPKQNFSQEQLFSLWLFALAFPWQIPTISRGMPWALVPPSCPGEVPGCFLIALGAPIFNGERLFCLFLSL